MSIDAAAYRQISGGFATGVTAVTTAVDGWLHGITANSFTSVSLDPLLLLVCIDKEAYAHEQLEKAGRFGVNILAEAQQEISNQFASKSPPEQGSLRGAAYHLGPNGMPILEGCLAYLECELTDHCAGGDHTIFIGKVLDGALTQETTPLLFYQGSYQRLQP